MDPLYALPGDVFFTHSNSLLGRLIRWAESDPDEEGGAWANHTGVVVTPGWIVPPITTLRLTPAVVVESLWKTERWAWWENHKDDKSNEIRVYRNTKLTLEQIRKIEQTANTFVGDTYGWWKLGAHLIDRAVFGGVKTVSHFLHIDKRPICSYTAAKSFDAAGVRFGLDPETADPDEMMDYCERSDEWKLVGSSLVGGGK